MLQSFAMATKKPTKPADDADNEAVTLRLPPRLATALRVRAAEERKTMSEIAKRALEAYLAKPAR